MQNPFLEESSYNPVRAEDPALDPKTNLDEYAIAAGRESAECKANARLFPPGAARQFFVEKSRIMGARHVALLAAHYIETELLETGDATRNRGNVDLVRPGLLAVRAAVEALEAGTCPATCRELRDALEAFNA